MNNRVLMKSMNLRKRHFDTPVRDVVEVCSPKSEVWSLKIHLAFRSTVTFYCYNIIYSKILIVTFCPVTFCPFTQINTITYNNFSFILGIFTRESYSPEQSTHIILKADVTPSLRVLLKVVLIIILLIQRFKSSVLWFFYIIDMMCREINLRWRKTVIFILYLKSRMNIVK